MPAKCPAPDVEEIEEGELMETWQRHGRGCGKKGHYKKVCLQGKCSAHSLESLQMTSAGAAAGEPLYFNDEGQPVYTYMVSVPPCKQTLN